MDEDEEYGYIFECDLDYPRELHNEHKDLLLAPEHYNKKDFVQHYLIKKIMLFIVEIWNIIYKREWY